MQQRTFHLVTSQILALSVTPVEIVPAPGANRTLIPITLHVRLNFGTLAFLAGGNLALSLGVPANGVAIDLGNSLPFGDVVSAEAQYVIRAVPAFHGSVANCANQNLELYNLTAPFTTGDGSVDLTIFFGTSKLL